MAREVLFSTQFAREICGIEPKFGNGDFDRIVSREDSGHVRAMRQLIVRAWPRWCSRSTRDRSPRAPRQYALSDLGEEPVPVIDAIVRVGTRIRETALPRAGARAQAPGGRAARANAAR